MKEPYYAIQIGNRPKYYPYFMVRDDEMTPQLFNSRKEAEAARSLLSIPSTARVRRVFVQTAK